MRGLTVLLATLLLPAAALADSIVLNGVRHENVRIEEGASMYYILLPDSGEVLNARKSEVDPNDVVISEDEGRRQSLRDQWKEARGISPAPAVASPMARVATVAASDDAKTAIKSVRASGRGAQPGADGASGGDAYATDGYLDYVSLRNVSLSDALKAALRPLNLDYQAESGYLYVSSPERLRKEAHGPATARIHPIRFGMSGTLPKIVVRNQGVSGPRGGFGGMGYGGYGGGFPGGMGHGGYGGGLGGMGYGGYGGGVGGMGYGGFGGGFGGGRRFGGGVAGCLGYCRMRQPC
ncbi:MAG TPA: hypothetical protein PKL84_13940, partial [Candidatus Hydrogenedentes bacterium]|nr:hypothetical protein [Candidatus Hydrogenedentota bacterium]